MTLTLFFNIERIVSWGLRRSDGLRKLTNDIVSPPGSPEDELSSRSCYNHDLTSLSVDIVPKPRSDASLLGLDSDELFLELLLFALGELVRDNLIEIRIENGGKIRLGEALKIFNTLNKM